MAHEHEHTHTSKRRGPEITCSCGCSSKQTPAGPFDKAVDNIAEKVEHILPGKAAAWFCNLETEGRRDLVCIIAAALLFIVGMAIRMAGTPAAGQALVFLLAYLAVGYNILAKAVRNIRKGDFFDENLLMSIASIGAFALGEFPEAVAVMLFYRIGEFFEDRAVDKSRDQIMDAVDMRPETVNLLTAFNAQEDASSHHFKVVDPEHVHVGDYVLIRPGERIPLDAVVVEGQSRIDTSPVTGEPVPVAVNVGSALTSGCVNETGQLVARVEKPLSESMVTRILDAVENAAANKPQIERFITRFARIYTPIVIAIAVATAIIPSLVTGNWTHWVYTACTFLVISCPCAIVLSVPLAFFAGIGAAGKQGILLKGGNVIEALHGIKAVVMDKTGTITRGVFEVQHIEPTQHFTQDEVLICAASAEQASTHPIAQSIASAASARGARLLDAKHVEEVAGEGLMAQLQAAGADALHVAVGNEKLMQRVGARVPSNHEAQLGSTVVYVAIEGAYAGSIDIADAIKDESTEAISKLAHAGIHTAMLTGDANTAAHAIAQATGVDEVHAELLPEEKVDVLQRVRNAQGAAMFVGDGINDAPVLAAADVGAAMGSGSDAAIEAADVVFMTSSLSAVPDSLALAHRVHAVAIQNIVFALVVKIGIMILGFAGIASMWAAVFADVGVALLCILNSVRLLRMKS